jgi:hypothetical protein
MTYSLSLQRNIYSTRNYAQNIDYGTKRWKIHVFALALVTENGRYLYSTCCRPEKLEIWNTCGIQYQSYEATAQTR